MTKHTPGPWKTSNMAPGIVYAETGGRRDELVCTAYRRDNDEHKANAALIASAPDLLAALRNLLDHTCGTDSFCEWCERHAPKDHEGSLTGPIPHVSDCLRLAAERAIAKAEGRG